ncbi:TonB-dependent receptor [Edaphobacter aggregans]|uniref:TonB-dependent receptor n=1 Tax=Edaphobacter aggregans TaxID=570835 RepID=UPI00054E2FCB|nr:TonB-dependent receptor [Edaphobacter aggregans]
MSFVGRNVVRVALVWVLGWSVAAVAAERAVMVCVKDERGAAVAGAVVASGGAEVTTDASGCAQVRVEGAQSVVAVLHEGFAAATQAAGGSDELDVVLRVAGASSVVEVTAARTPLALDASASSVRTMPAVELKEIPGFTLDDRLRQVAGFQLFRRTSSWVANPTTQGTSLRGLGSTAASRTLVLSDQVPLNDAFGGWIHWNEIPQLAMREVEVMRGGASDLYGSSAIGGVIDVVPVVPEGFGYGLEASGASESTSTVNGLLAGTVKGVSGLGAMTLFRTGGYILTAPEVRGPVDVPSNVHSQSGRLEFRHGMGTDSAVFLRGNLLNEARSNGTPLTTNATRIWRYAGGGDWNGTSAGRFLLRLHGANQGYRQSFSSVAPGRATERLTRLQEVPSAQLGAVGQWARTFGAWTAVAGADVLDTRGTDNETPVVNGLLLGTVSTSARQRDTGVYGELLWQPKTWSVALSSRVDHFASFDARQVAATPVPVLPEIAETIFDPRLGVVKQLRGGVSLTASAFRAFRGPSLNELYRTGQVGQQTTLANPALRSERATGWEAGGLVNLHRIGSVRASYFWTQVNRPVAAVALVTTPTSQLLQRQNLGQLTSKGVTLEAEIRPVEFIVVKAGYQYADSTVTKFQADPTLVGKWTAQVPRNSASVEARMEKERWGVFGVYLRTSGQQFDDSANQYRLAPYAQVDLYAEHAFGRMVKVWASVQNVADTRVEAGRTPLLTLGAPRIVAGGIRLH